MISGKNLFEGNEASQERDETANMTEGERAVYEARLKQLKDSANKNEAEYLKNLGQKMAAAADPKVKVTLE